MASSLFAVSRLVHSRESARARVREKRKRARERERERVYVYVYVCVGACVTCVSATSDDDDDDGTTTTKRVLFRGAVRNSRESTAGSPEDRRRLIMPAGSSARFRKKDCSA